MEKALFIEITVNNFLELECMKPKIQEAQRLLNGINSIEYYSVIYTYMVYRYAYTYTLPWWLRQALLGS